MSGRAADGGMWLRLAEARPSASTPVDPTHNQLAELLRDLAGRLDRGEGFR